MKRYERILELKNTGLSLADCGKAMGITVNTARTYYYHAKHLADYRQEREQALMKSFGYWYQYRDKLSMRALNLLRINKISNIQELSEIPKEKLKRWRNMGKKTLKEIADFLCAAPTSSSS